MARRNTIDVSATSWGEENLWADNSLLGGGSVTNAPMTLTELQAGGVLCPLAAKNLMQRYHSNAL